MMSENVRNMTEFWKGFRRGYILGNIVGAVVIAVGFVVWVWRG